MDTGADQIKRTTHHGRTHCVDCRHLGIGVIIAIVIPVVLLAIFVWSAYWLMKRDNKYDPAPTYNYKSIFWRALACATIILIPYVVYLEFRRARAYKKKMQPEEEAGQRPLDEEAAAETIGPSEKAFATPEITEGERKERKFKALF